MPQDSPIGLALSGGGFRATLFHLGVVRFLYEKQMLQRVVRICSVSGGSILSAHLVLNWTRYCGSEKEFAAAAKEVLDFVRHDVRGRIVRRALFAYVSAVPVMYRFIRWLLGRDWRDPWSRTELLKEQYRRRLYKDATLGKLSASEEEASRRPELHILATSMTTGDLFAFTEKGVSSVSRELGRAPEETRYDIETIPLEVAVASSSAFPPYFPPLKVTHQTLRTSQKQFPQPQYLGDGGVFDNLGLRHLLDLGRLGAPPHPSLLLVSDAQPDCDWWLGNRFAFVPQRAIRATDLLMKRITELEYETAARRSDRATGGGDLLVCRLQASLEAADGIALDASQHRSVTQIRTDLDRFSDSEIALLLEHGYEVARKAFGGALGEEADEERKARSELIAVRFGLTPPSPLKEPRRRLKLGLFSARDWTSWATVVLLLAMSAPFVLPFYIAFARRRSDVNQLQQAFVLASDSYAKRLRLSPGPSVTFARGGKHPLGSESAVWDSQNKSYVVDLKYAGTPGLAEYVALMSRFFVRLDGECEDGNQFRDEFRIGLAHYIIRSDGDTKAGSILPGSYPLSAAFLRMEAEAGPYSRDVKILAVRVFFSFACNWSRDTLRRRVLVVRTKTNSPVTDRIVATGFPVKWTDPAADETVASSRK